MMLVFAVDLPLISSIPQLCLLPSSICILASLSANHVAFPSRWPRWMFTDQPGAR